MVVAVVIRQGRIRFKPLPRSFSGFLQSILASARNRSSR